MEANSNNIIKAVGIIRCSSKPQFEKYGPDIQARTITEGCSRFPKGKIEIIQTFQLQERATGWNRNKWDALMAQCAEMFQRGEIQVVVFPRVDRETRFLAGSFDKLTALVRAGCLIYFADTGLLLGKDNPDAWEQYQKEALEAQGFIRTMRKNTKAGRERAAETGKIPAAVGRYSGYLGLRYNRTTKMLENVPDQIAIAREILARYIHDEAAVSISKLTLELQARRVKGTAGGLIQRSAVYKVLKHARVYAGVYLWKGKEIRDRVPQPIITENEAEMIAGRLKRNKEAQEGFGKRKPETGRVFCGICGARFALETGKKCHCNRNSYRYQYQGRCASPTLSYQDLKRSIMDSFMAMVGKPEVFIGKLIEARTEWDKRKALAAQFEVTQSQWQEQHDKRRRLLSFQHEHGGISDDEYLKRLGELKKELPPTAGRFIEPSPLSPEQFLKLIEQLRQHFQSYFGSRKPGYEFDARMTLPLFVRAISENDDMRQKLYDQFDVTAIINHPRQPGEKYAVDIVMSLPTVTDDTRAMVSSSSRCYARPQRQPQEHASRALDL